MAVGHTGRRWGIWFFTSGVATLQYPGATACVGTREEVE